MIEYMIPFDRLIVRTWENEDVQGRSKRAVFHRRPDGLFCVLLNRYDERQRVTRAYNATNSVPADTEHWLVGKDKTAGFLLLYHQGMTAQALRLIGLKPVGEFPW